MVPLILKVSALLSFELFQKYPAPDWMILFYLNIIKRNEGGLSTP